MNNVLLERPVDGPTARVRQRRMRRIRALLILVVVLALVLAGLTGFALLRSRGLVPGADPVPIPTDFRPGPADGYIATGSPVSSFDEDLPAIAKLDPALRSAVQQAQTAAEADGVTFVITSGWRSDAYQQWLLKEAIRDYGPDVARQRVAEPGTSAHESGHAVDIGYTDADSWMMQHGSAYGLCQIYANEIWHFELATTPGGACPEQLPGAEAR